MNVTLTLDDTLVKEIRKIAAERETTLTGLVREYLQQLAAENDDSERKRQELELLNLALDKFQRPLGYGNRTWKREDLYDRKSK
jgi:Family of unknown function (DUF6364)